MSAKFPGGGGGGRVWPSGRQSKIPVFSPWNFSEKLVVSPWNFKILRKAVSPWNKKYGDFSLPALYFLPDSKWLIVQCTTSQVPYNSNCLVISAPLLRHWTFEHCYWFLMNMWLDSLKCVVVAKMALFPTSTQILESIYMYVSWQNN